MRATVMHGRHENVPDPTIQEPTDALVRVTRACNCGSDLWAYNLREPGEAPQSMGQEAVGVVEAVGSAVRTRKKGDVVVMPLAVSDGTCAFCHEGLHTACAHVSFVGNNGLNGAQAEALRIPCADGTLYLTSVGEDDALMPSRLTLSDGRGTGHHAAVVARVAPGKTAADVGDDGAVGPCGVLSANRLGAERIILLGRHPDRIALAREFGATDMVSERGEEAVARVMELTGGFGAHSVLECVGAAATTDTHRQRSPGWRRGPRGGAAARLEPARAALAIFKNVIVSGGPAPTRAYIADLLPDVLEGRIEPGRVFDRTVNLDGVPDGYRAMNGRESIKVMVRP